MSTIECGSTLLVTCLVRLADGWILPSDLCPACTCAFMAALDGIAGPMNWHADYTARAQS
jgi:hypothetical protein